MKRIVILIGLIVVLAGLAAYGVSWEEERGLRIDRSSCIGR
jgi:hypothetical protein